MSAAHTPGPWFSDEDHVIRHGAPGSAYQSPIMVASGWIEDAWRGDDSNEESRANARLIAAAPTLLEACKAQHEALDTLLAFCIAQIPGFMPTRSAAWPAIVQGNKAIAAATGAAQ